MKSRPYEELQSIVEDEGGEMVFERQGHGPGGAWIVTLRGRTTVFASNGAGFPPMDQLYVPKVASPSHYRDYSNDLIPGARERWLGMLASEGVRPAAAPVAWSVQPASKHVAESAVLPPFDGAAQHLARIKSSRNLPERNMEDVVRELLVLLGHAPTSIVFQVGRIDVLVQDEHGKPRYVIEVKTSLRSKSERDAALRQAFDYANRNGAPLVVITDADQYEIYDRTAGLEHASMLRATFRLTEFYDRDISGLELLRP
jgi:hypothetical protein